MGKEQRNWAGNYKYSATRWHFPRNIEEIQQLMCHLNRVRVIGTRHSFNGIADSTEDMISLKNLNKVVSLDCDNMTVTVEGGITYSDLCRYLHKHGYALPNLASLPHISVAGACATATHGSGDKNSNLASAVILMEVVTGTGEVVHFSRKDNEQLMNGVVVGLGGIGIVTKLTLSIIPTFTMKQYVYENLPMDVLESHFDDIFSSAYSISLFTDWKNDSFNQVWLKDIDSFEAGPDFFGASLVSENRHPAHSIGAENCTDQSGIPGPWFERLPHFRMDFTPSNGKELQSEYIVPRRHAYDAICAIHQLGKPIAPLLHISEVRTIAKDELWMSPCYQQDSVAIHFTWKDDREAVQKVLPKIEEKLEPYNARPHWGKLFTMPPAKIQSLYERLPDFQQLLQNYDSQGKFRNEFLNKNIFGEL